MRLGKRVLLVSSDDSEVLGDQSKDKGENRDHDKDNKLSHHNVVNDFGKLDDYSIDAQNTYGAIFFTKKKAIVSSWHI
jgi:hypothetical protein